MATEVEITLTSIGADADNFSIYTDLDSYTTPIETGIAKALLSAGYTVFVPYGATIVRVQATGDCTNYIDIPIYTLVSGNIKSKYGSTFSPNSITTFGSYAVTWDCDQGFGQVVGNYPAYPFTSTLLEKTMTITGVDSVTFLSFVSKRITYFDGTNFENLQSLIILSNTNLLAFLDMTDLTSLLNLVFEAGALTSFVLPNQFLHELDVRSGQNLTALPSLTGLTKLTSASFENIGAGSIDLRNATGLQQLNVRYSNVSSIQGLDNSSIVNDCYIDFGSGFTTLDFTGNLIDRLFCTDNDDLATVDLTNCNNLDDIRLYNNPLLTSVTFVTSNGITVDIFIYNSAITFMDLSGADGLVGAFQFYGNGMSTAQIDAQIAEFYTYMHTFDVSTVRMGTNRTKNVLKSGTLTGGSGSVVNDSGASFLSDGIVAGDLFRNLTTGAYKEVATVDSDTQITLNETGGGFSGNSYEIDNSTPARQLATIGSTRNRTVQETYAV